MKRFEKVTELVPQVILEPKEMSVENEDQDGCQWIDESSEEWVRKWRESIGSAKKPEKGWTLHVHLCGRV